jgi:hypothetical protein
MHLHDLTSVPATDPVDLYRMRDGLYAADMLLTALVHLDLFSWPAMADVHLYSNVLHDWDEPVVRELLKKSFAALPAGGLVMIHDAYLNAAKNGPLHVAEYSVLLMHSSEGRCYSVAEMGRYLTDAGFRDVSYVPSAAVRGVVTARK